MCLDVRHLYWAVNKWRCSPQLAILRLSLIVSDLTLLGLTDCNKLEFKGGQLVRDPKTVDVICAQPLDDSSSTLAVGWSACVGGGGEGEVSCQPPDDARPCWLHHRRPRLLVAAEAESVEAHVLEAGVGHEQGLQGDEPWGGARSRLTWYLHMEINWAPAPNVTQEIPRNPNTQHSATSSIMLARRVMKQPWVVNLNIKVIRF